MVSTEKRFLVVDDSPLIRAMLKKTLHERGYQFIETAEDGLDAKEKLKNSCYDMVISDYDMPNMNGAQLLDFVKSSKPEVLVIMLSAQADRKRVVSLMRQAENYIVKDSMHDIKEEFFVVIESAFEKDRLKRENQRLMNELRQRDKRMQLELETAKYLLDEILPRRIPSSPVFEVKVMNRLSNMIGGDFFSINKFDQSMGVMLADISGHGIPAALLMLTLRNAIARSLENPEQTDLVLRRLNDYLLESFPESKYATVSYLFLNEADRSMCYTNEFQNPIFYLKKDGSLEELDNGKLKLLGIYKKSFFANGDLELESGSVTLSEGERIFIFTDGIVEAKDKDEQEFGMQRIKEIILQYAKNSLSDTIKAMYASVYKFANAEIVDDITIVGIGLK